MESTNQIHDDNNSRGLPSPTQSMVWSAPQKKSLEARGELEWPKHAFLQREFLPTFGDNFVNDTDEDRDWKNMVHKEFGLKQRSAFTQKLPRGNRTLNAKPLHWQQPRIRSLSSITVGNDECMNENATNHSKTRVIVEPATRHVPPPVQLTLPKRRSQHRHHGDGQYTVKRKQKPQCNSKSEIFPKMLEKNRNGFRSVLIDLEQRVKSLPSPDMQTGNPSIGLNILSELSQE